MSCEKFVHTEELDMDWVCVCGHDTDWHNYGPSSPGGPCEACARGLPAIFGDSRHWSDGTPVDDAEMEANSHD